MCSGRPQVKLSTKRVTVHSLRTFLVGQFVCVLMLIAITRSLVDFLVDRTIVPIIVGIFFPSCRERSSIKGASLFVFVVYILLLLVMGTIQVLLPSPLRKVVR